MRMRYPVSLLIVAVVSVAPAAAQMGGPATALRQFRDSVDAIADTVELRALESRLMLAARRDRSNAMLHVRLGVVADRLGANRDAAAEYKWATELEPGWPAAWFAWALAELRLGDEVETAETNRRLVVARDAWSRATRAIARAVELDSSFAAIAFRQLQTALVLQRSDWAGVIRDGLRASAELAARQSSVWLWLGRAERAVGDSAKAVAAFEQAARFPETRGIAQLERARTLLSLVDDRGIDAYYDGSTTSDPQAVAEYRADLALVASPTELARFDGAEGTGRASLLWSIWTGRDRRELRRTGERLKEHYRRIAVAMARFGGLADLRSQVLIRHGEPDGRATLSDPAVAMNESWVYRRAAGEMAVHFVGVDAEELSIVGSLLEVAGIDPDQRGPAGDDGPKAARVGVGALLRSRAQLSPFYQAAADADPSQRAVVQERERAISQLGKDRALSTDGHPLRFARDLPGRAQLAGLVGPPGGPSLSLFFAIPGFAAKPRGGAGLALYPIRVRMVIRDSLAVVVRALDTVVVVERDRPVATSDRVSGQLDVPVPSGRYAVRMALEYDSAGVVVARDSIRLAEREPESMLLSDILASGPGASLRWPTGDSAGVSVDPAPVLARGDTLSLFTQLLGAEAGRARLRVLVRPSGGLDDDKPARWRPFPGYSGWVPLQLPGSSGATSIRVAIPTRRLNAGAFDLQLVVVDRIGATAWQYSRFEVDDRS